MKAAQIDRYGDASVVAIAEITKPAVKEHDVLVEVRAASLNPFDTIVRAGYLKDMMSLQLPFTLGGDIAGIVVEVGANVTGVTIGDRVYGQANVVAGNSGAFAEYAATSAGEIAVMPANLDFTEAASLPLVGVGALQGLVDHIKLQSGQNLFIHGGAGAVGRVAIQLAKHIGAYVATTATGDGIAVAKEAGADKIIDYKHQNFAEIIQEYDAVFDTVGGDDFTKSLAIVKPGGTAVSMVVEASESKAAELGVRVLRQDTHVTTKALDVLRHLIESGTVTPKVGKIFGLGDIQQAFKERESGVVIGKVVLEIK